METPSSTRWHGELFRTERRLALDLEASFFFLRAGGRAAGFLVAAGFLGMTLDPFGYFGLQLNRS
jgi:hypothetical protein